MDTAALWSALTLYALVAPYARAVFEIALFIVRRGAESTLCITEAEEWRKRLRRPMVDSAMVLGPCFGALLLPEGG
jgi:hypothetical protein